ncbi:MAG TPA: peptidase E [Solirubrobacterales bacterium]|nr:peptidase E [Solirubrobacterales bacterium]
MSATEGTIVAMGGAEFAMRSENEALHDYVLAQTGSEQPRVCLLPTAGGDPHDQIRAFHAAMDRRGARATSISLFRLGEGDVDIDVRGVLLAQDLVYVTGGNMVNLMTLWREHGIAEILRDAYAAGTVLCGYSAGSMCWFERGLSRGVGRPVPTHGLGLIAGSHCVHYSQDPDRRSEFRRLIGAGELPDGLALDDHAAALFRGGRLQEAVASSSAARAFRVYAGADGAVEEGLDVRMLTAGRPAGVDALDEMRALRRMRSRRRPT